MSGFHVVRMDGKNAEIYSDGNGNPFIFSNAKIATEAAQNLTANFNAKYQIRPVKTGEDWRKREKERFKAGYYTKVPWHKEPWVKESEACVDHFVHVSRQNQVNIAFTVDSDRGEQDVKATMKPSKYLMKFYGKIIPEDGIRELVARYKQIYDKDNCLSFAYDAKDIVRVYRTGPNSCMKHNSFRTKVHPTSVYAGPDLAVAYVEQKGRISARAVCWPKKRLYSRIYGDIYLLENLLAEEGFSPGSLEGARLTKIKQGARYVCPYIDGIHRVNIGTKYLRITTKGKRYAANQDGYCGQGFRCALCHAEYDVHKAGEPGRVNNHTWCRPCLDNAIANDQVFQCIISSNYYQVEQRARLIDGRTLHQAYLNGSNAFTCHECNQNYLPNERNNYTGRVDARGNRMYRCNSCATRQGEMNLTQTRVNQAITSSSSTYVGTPVTTNTVRISNIEAGNWTYIVNERTTGE